MGWTGVQYSAFRAALAIAVAQVCLSRLPLVEGPGWPLLALGLPGAFVFALGWRDRAVTINLLALVAGIAALVDGAPLVLPQTDVILTGSLLVFHLFTPVTPFGSWDARGRIDPRGDWHRPAWLGDAAWLWLVAVHLAFALVHWGEAARSTAELDFVLLARVTAFLEIAFTVTLFRRAWRPYAWVALTLWQIAWFTAFGSGPGSGAIALILLHLFAADPGWWPGRRLRPLAGEAKEPAHLFYDGECGFCHRSVRLVLSEELGTPESLRLRFAPLQGEAFSRLTSSRDDIDADALPDSIVLMLEDGALLTRSAAALEIASRLGGLWRGIALAFSLLPSAGLDRAYDGIARVRKRIFSDPKDACPILPPELRARFDL